MSPPASFSPQSRTAEPPIKFEIGDVVEVVRAQSYVGERGEIVSDEYTDGNNLLRQRVSLRCLEGRLLDAPKTIGFQKAHLDLVYPSVRASEVQQEFEQNRQTAMAEMQRLRVGDEVEFHGLRNREDLNGRRGKIQRPLAVFRPRCGVLLLHEQTATNPSETNEAVQVLPKNLKRITEREDEDAEDVAEEEDGSDELGRRWAQWNAQTCDGWAQDYHTRRLETLIAVAAARSSNVPKDAFDRRSPAAHNYVVGCCVSDGSDDPVIRRACDVRKNQEDGCGDGDQSALTILPGGPGADLEQYWSMGGNFNPYERPHEYTPLMRAACWGNVCELEAVLGSIADSQRKTCLEYRQSSLRMTPLLGCVGGARLCDLKKGVISPAHWAPAASPPTAESFKTGETDFAKCARLLCEAGARVDCKDILGKTPLMQCCNGMASTCSLAVAEVLVEFGADLYPLCRLGNCLLMEACNSARKDCIQKMLELGVDPDKMWTEMRMGAGMNLPGAPPSRFKLKDVPMIFQQSPAHKECLKLLKQGTKLKKAAAKSGSGAAAGNRGKK